jgi:hypothetical protein
MASPYTKDITKSSAFRQVTGQDQDKFDQFLQGAVQVKKAYNNKVADNIDALQENKVLEIQKKKLLLKGLNGVSTIQNDIEQNFNGNIDSWARNYAQQELRNEAIAKSCKQIRENISVYSADSIKSTAIVRDNVIKATANIKDELASLEIV